MTLRKYLVTKKVNIKYKLDSTGKRSIQIRNLKYIHN
jgi:hypothetical protein